MAKPKRKKDSGKNYTIEELQCILKYIEENGNFRTYEEGNKYADIHKEKTGMERSGAALYMCAWRIANGVYDDILKPNRKDKK